MKINQLENLIISTLGAANNNENDTKPNYNTVKQQQPSLEVHDNRQAQENNQNEENRALPSSKTENTKTIEVVNNRIPIILKQLKEGKDFGSLPGIPTPILFKPGAIKIIKFFKLRVREELLDKTVDVKQSFISYTIKVSLLDSEGTVVTEAIGCANNLEKKFAKAAMSADSMLVGISAKRALIAAAKFLINR